MAHRVFIAVGSNMGQRAGNCRDAVRRLNRGGEVTLKRKSSFYETEPWGKAGQRHFINAVIEVRTALSATALLKRLKSIEKEMGRARTARWGPRVIDLDILFYGDKVIHERGLDVPHPGLHERPFVLVPLNEIAPEFVHPVFKESVSSLLAKLGSPDIRPVGV